MYSTPRPFNGETGIEPAHAAVGLPEKRFPQPWRASFTSGASVTVAGKRLMAVNLVSSGRLRSMGDARRHLFFWPGK